MTASFLKRAKKPALAYVKTEADAKAEGQPMVVFLGGFRSDMEGTKALFLEKVCRAGGLGFIRFDYSGHGVSEGEFNDYVLSDWAADALDILDVVAGGVPLVLVGSSMGGWISLLCALARPTQVKGIVGLAAAVDFTIDMLNEMGEEERTSLRMHGYVDLPNDYSGEPYRITQALIDDGAKNFLLDKGIDINMPVRLIQGKQDTDVAWEHAARIKGAIAGKDVEVFLVEDGDHRLSRPEDLRLLEKMVFDVLARVAELGSA